MRVVLPEIVSVLLVGFMMAACGVGFFLEKGFPAWAAPLMTFCSGFCVGYAATFAVAARQKDEELRLELLASARALVDKEHFGGFRRHE